jgi:hypothetical protein
LYFSGFFFLIIHILKLIWSCRYVFIQKVKWVLLSWGTVSKNNSSSCCFLWNFFRLRIIQSLDIIRRVLFLYNWAYIKNFYKLLAFFSKLIYYKCSFFFNVLDLNSKIKKEISLLNFNYINSLQIFFWTSRIFKVILFKNIYNYYMSHVFSINSKVWCYLLERDNLKSLQKLQINIILYVVLTWLYFYMIFTLYLFYVNQILRILSYIFFIFFFIFFFMLIVNYINQYYDIKPFIFFIIYEFCKFLIL